MEIINKKSDTPSNISMFCSIFKSSLAYALFLGLLAYGYLMTNGFYSHDSIVTIFAHADDNWQISLGRFLQPYVRELLFGTATTYWYLGALGIIFSSLSSVFIFLLFNQQNRFILFFINSILILNLSSILLVSTYIQHFCIYSLAQLCSIISVFILFKSKRYWFLSFIFLYLSLSLYQLYLSTFIVLLSLKLIGMLLADIKDKTDIWKNIKRSICCLLLSSISYYLSIRFFSNYFNVKLANSYNSIEKAFLFSNKGISLFWDTYIFPFKFLTTPTVYWINLLIIITFILLFISILYLFISVKSNNKLLIALLVITLPFSSNLTVFISGGLFHELLLTPIFYSLFIFILPPFNLCFVSFDNFKARRLFKLEYIYSLFLVIYVTLFSFNSIKFANILAEKKHLEFVQSDSNLKELLFRLENIPGYKKGITPVEIIAPRNKISGGLFNTPQTEFSNLYSFTGHWNSSIITDPWYIQPYLIKYLNKDINLKGIKALEDSPLQGEDQNSYIFKDGTLYIRFK